jgi:hypothetical protein
VCPRVCACVPVCMCVYVCVSVVCLCVEKGIILKFFAPQRCMLMCMINMCLLFSPLVIVCEKNDYAARKACCRQRHKHTSTTPITRSTFIRAVKKLALYLLQGKRGL